MVDGKKINLHTSNSNSSSGGNNKSNNIVAVIIMKCKPHFFLLGTIRRLIG